MPSTAISAQRSVFRLNTAVGTAKNLTAITKANPAVVTSAAHGLANGDIVKIDSVAGMVELNGRAFVVANVTTNTFELRGTDSTSYTTYTSGGTATPQTMGRVGNVKNFNISQDEAAEITVTNLDSTRQEYALGLPGSWNCSLDVDIDPTDIGQAELEKAQNDGISRVFTLTLSNNKVFIGVGFMKSKGASGSPDAVVSGPVSIRGTGQPGWFV